MKLKIKITKEILKQSMYCGEGISDELKKHTVMLTSCAVSLAVRDIFPDALTNNCNIYTHKTEIKLPMVAQEFIYGFDLCTPEQRAEELTPISFEIEVPEEIINSIGISEVHKILANSDTLELIEQ